MTTIRSTSELLISNLCDVLKEPSQVSPRFSNQATLLDSFLAVHLCVICINLHVASFFISSQNWVAFRITHYLNWTGMALLSLSYSS
ncbi:hypothetical protein EDD17DRAFT_1676091 [Pisolithus thermaeus]|nr:hypothetical protein EDD17DRAFT_1676091 [Pisolithus thermaeus]